MRLMKTIRQSEGETGRQGEIMKTMYPTLDCQTADGHRYYCPGGHGLMTLVKGKRRTYHCTVCGDWFVNKS